MREQEQEKRTKQSTLGREKETERGGGTNQRTGKNNLQHQGTRKVFREGEKQSSNEEGREKQGAVEERK